MTTWNKISAIECPSCKTLMNPLKHSNCPTCHIEAPKEQTFKTLYLKDGADVGLSIATAKVRYTDTEHKYEFTDFGPTGSDVDFYNDIGDPCAVHFDKKTGIGEITERIEFANQLLKEYPNDLQE